MEIKGLLKGSSIQNDQIAISSGTDDQFTISTTTPSIGQPYNIPHPDAFGLFTPQHYPDDTRLISSTCSSDRTGIVGRGYSPYRIDSKHDQFNTMNGALLRKSAHRCRAGRGCSWLRLLRFALRFMPQQLDFNPFQTIRISSFERKKKT